MESSSFISGDLLHISHIDSEMRLVNVKEFSKAGVALELVEYQALVSRHIDAARECLKSQWFMAVQNIFLLVSELVSSSQMTEYIVQIFMTFILLVNDN